MKTTAWMLAGAAALALGTAAQADTVRIGIAAEPYPPFTSPDAAGNWQGWEIDIINAICEAAELDCEIVPTSWDGIIPALLGQQIDAIMNSMSITEDRMQVIDFSDPYYNTPTVIVAPKDIDITPTPGGLAGRVLGVQVATIHQTYAQEYFEGDTTLRIYQTQDEANQDLYAGRIDATQADSLAMEAFLESAEGQCCEIKGAVEHDERILGAGVGAGIRKEDTELKEAINRGLAQILEDGTYDAISEQYFTVSIYGN
ncbi:transporter substrate-binding domain-containing protein [Pararhodobacter sp. SW119]|uniref:transporter substrate-binding domain-containing protein n=1 Tax=Pararhodobacter sp. SW119 TaxID=2780075 RepID=UPI001AE0BF00|nr:transporter substrate-binding domain-containing protein [Pararhodobacter sp. SW119]